MRLPAKLFLWILLPVLLALAAVPALAANGAASYPLSCTVSESADSPCTVQLQRVDGELYLFLPASADLTALRLEFPDSFGELRWGNTARRVLPGEPFDLRLLGIQDGTGPWRLTFFGRDTWFFFTLMRSSGTASVFLSSPDAEHGRAWVEQSKDNKVKGAAMLMLDADGGVVYDGDLKQIKGRGNSTWTMPKRPYQIKLSKATDLMETGLPGEANGTWVLLADYLDDSHLHNRLTFALADAFGLPYTPHCRSVDLWYDGEYRGTYLLSEKTEVGAGRVDIRDLESEIGKANKGTGALDDPVLAVGVNAYGNRFRYTEGAALPEDYGGGYLLELEYADRVNEEASWFETSAGSYVTVKSPEYLPEDAMRYISERWQAFEDALTAHDGAAVAELADMESLARVYLILEYARDWDAYFSSTYFCLPAADGKFVCGPVWDFDNSYLGGTEGFTAASQGIGSHLRQLPEFRSEVLRLLPEFRRLLETVVLSDDPAAAEGALRPLSVLEAELTASWNMDRVLWPILRALPAAGRIEPLQRTSCSDAMRELRRFLRDRLDWLVPALNELDPSSPFLDVDDEAYYAGAVLWAYRHEPQITTGVSNSFFAPESPCTRAHVVTFLWRAMGQPAPETTDCPFGDVADAAYYRKAVLWAAEHGVTTGVSETEFGPDLPCTRGQIVTFLHRALGLPEPASDAAPFTDTAEGEYYAQAVLWAVEQGVTTGVSETEFGPDAVCTRAQAMTFLHRALAD